jgi:hypothetical protein
MKNVPVLLFILFCTHRSFAQLELKVNPISLLFETIDASIEYSNLKNKGIQLDAKGSYLGNLVYVTGKYYLAPRKGADGFHMDVFLGGKLIGRDPSVGIGFAAGYKILSAKGLLFETALGLGRGLPVGRDEKPVILPYWSIGVGYRFNRKP